MCLESVFKCGCLAVPAPYIKKTIFSPFYLHCSFVKDQLAVFVWIYFWALFCSTDLFVYSFINTTLSLFGYSFIVSLEITERSWTLFFLFRIAVVILGLLHICILEPFVNFYKIACWNCIDSIDQCWVFLCMYIEYLSMYLGLWVLSSKTCSFFK